MVMLTMMLTNTPDGGGKSEERRREEDVREKRVREKKRLRCIPHSLAPISHNISNIFLAGILMS